MRGTRSDHHRADHLVDVPAELPTADNGSGGERDDEPGRAMSTHDRNGRPHHRCAGECIADNDHEAARNRLWRAAAPDNVFQASQCRHVALADGAGEFHRMGHGGGSLDGHVDLVAQHGDRSLQPVGFTRLRHPASDEGIQIRAKRTGNRFGDDDPGRTDTEHNDILARVPRQPVAENASSMHPIAKAWL